MIREIKGDEIDGIATSSTSDGSISNIKSVDGGDAEIAWLYAHTAYNGYVGRGKFEKAYENVRHFATLYPAMFQVAVPSGSPIQTFDDMASANISPGKTGWTGTAFAEAILSAHDITFDSIEANGGTVHHVSYTESVTLIKDGHVDVFMAATSMPQTSFIELEHSPGIRFIGLADDKLQAILGANPGFIDDAMPAGIYESVEDDLKTLGIVTNLVASKDLCRGQGPLE